MDCIGGIDHWTSQSIYLIFGVFDFVSRALRSKQLLCLISQLPICPHPTNSDKLNWQFLAIYVTSPLIYGFTSVNPASCQYFIFLFQLTLLWYDFDIKFCRCCYHLFRVEVRQSFPSQEHIQCFILNFKSFHLSSFHFEFDFNKVTFLTQLTTEWYLKQLVPILISVLGLNSRYSIMCDRSVITLQIGHYANHIGAHFWNTQVKTFSLFC